MLKDENKKNPINKLNTNLILNDKIRRKKREKRTSLTIHMNSEKVSNSLIFVVIN
jgi:hypothetical protein